MLEILKTCNTIQKCFKVTVTSGNNRHSLNIKVFEEVTPSALTGSVKSGWFANDAHAFPSNATFESLHAQFKTTLAINHDSFSFSFHLRKTATVPAEYDSACWPGHSQKAEDANYLSLRAYPLKLSRSVSLE